MRKGLGKGLGQGYKNITPMDSHVHSLSARGVKTITKLQKRFEREDMSEPFSDREYVEESKSFYKRLKMPQGDFPDAKDRATYDIGHELIKEGHLDAKRHKSGELMSQVEDAFGEVPAYLDIVNKNLIKINVADWQGEREVEITPEDVIEYYDTQARNITSGVRKLGSEVGDWRNIDALAKESLEVFKIINRPALEKLGKKRGMTLKAKDKRDWLRTVIKFEDMNPDYPSTQMKGIALEIDRKFQDPDYIDEKIDNTKRFYSGTLDNFGQRIKHKDIQKEFRERLKSGSLDARGFDNRKIYDARQVGDTGFKIQETGDRWTLYVTAPSKIKGKKKWEKIQTSYDAKFLQQVMLNQPEFKRSKK